VWLPPNFVNRRPPAWDCKIRSQKMYEIVRVLKNFSVKIAKIKIQLPEYLQPAYLLLTIVNLGMGAHYDNFLW
jgi:hypothetical protein